MEILRSLDAMREWRASLAPDQRVGFAPTMGNLHAGHIELINVAKQRSDVVVASIFVNPMQFGGNEDLDAYPRTLEADLAKLEAAGAAAVFTPTTTDIYPDGVSQHTAVDVPGLTDVLCGASRPGHFRGVTTVVSKLLGIVRPHIAAFGAKDLQQVLVIKKMVRDLSINTEIDLVPTVRETDGLAMSSRNGYLSRDERALAPLFSRTLKETAKRLAESGSDIETVIAEAKAILTDSGFVLDYLEARHTYDLSKASSLNQETAIFGAAFLGTTRLIDNQIV
ncbi:MAG: pantoate--beta-alanine ligase [Halieaceae bacterium MED-G26]|nr:MAG: pantoate--beta-alanine ligase [Halieaceae bacterium MED-G26]|tara:strand:+ start:312 stop:1151 length:840 start_codon:yes stop_codon:yes gene_type:complete